MSLTIGLTLKDLPFLSAGASGAALAAVADWVARIQAAGGAAPSAANQLAHAQFYDNLNNHGILSKMRIIQTFTPDNIVAAVTPFMKQTTNSWGNGGVIDLTVNGLRGDGAARFLATGETPGTIWSSPTDCGCSFYATVKETAGSTHVAFGNFKTDASEAFLGYANQFTTDFAINFWAGDGSTSPKTANPGLGFFSCSRSSTTSCISYWGNTTNPLAQQGINTTSDTNPLYNEGGHDIVIFAVRAASSTVFDFSDIRLSGWMCHLALNSSQTSILKADFETLRTALGGGTI